MERFLARHASVVTGVLSGFDRLVFRGTLLPLVRERGMYAMLCRAGVRLLDFKRYVQDTSEQVKVAALTEAKRHDRPQIYLGSSTTSKEEVVRRVLAKQPVSDGLICTLSTVEPCMSFEYHRSQDHAERGLKLRPRKCLHIYQYRMHPRFGLVGARLQTWFPFNVQICMNGREWLTRQLTRAGSGFRRDDNCLPWLADAGLAQRLMDRQLTTDWPRALDAIARTLNPLHERIFRVWPMDYYWSAYQTEWATDVLFAQPRALDAVYPALVSHAMHHFRSRDVMRFLGRKTHGNFTGEITTSFKNRPEGVRVKHWVRGNSLKMYDKAGSVLRVETTIANPKDFKVLRPPHDDPNGTLAWKPMRKGVADLHRRAQVSQHANQRYLDALAVVEDDATCAALFDSVARPVRDGGRRFRPLRIGDRDDLAVLQAVAAGEFAAAGFRNRDLRPALYPRAASASPAQARRQTARIGRLLRLLRAHGLVRKVQKSHRYLLTPSGHRLAAAIFATRKAPLKALLAA